MAAIVTACAKGPPARPPDAGRTWAQLFTLSLVLLLPLLSSCAWLEQHQRRIALRPTPTLPQHVATAAASWQPGDTREMLSLPGGQQLAVWWLPQPDAAAPTLLYLHGTFRNLYQNLPKIDALRKAGFSIVAVDYRGWGDSTALVPSEDTITADTRLAWTEMQRRQPDAGKRVIYGHSMGGAVAVRLASELKHGQDYAALVLESTFTRMPDVATAAGFWGSVAGWATTLEFDSISRIGQVDAPVLMLHGSRDKTVPVELGRRLRDAARPGVQWVEFPNGTHSRLQQEAPDLYQQAFRDFLSPGKQKPAPPTRSTSP